MTDWTARAILTDIANRERRETILTSFWKNADQKMRQAASLQLAKTLRFRDETIRKSSPSKKAELFISRLRAPELQEFAEMALMVYHTSERKDLLAAFLDHWQIPHVDGSIETEEYQVPDRDKVEEAVSELRSGFEMQDILIYLATIGLLMGDAQQGWRDATWPVVDQLVGEVGGDVRSDADTSLKA